MTCGTSRTEMLATIDNRAEQPIRSSVERGAPIVVLRERGTDEQALPSNEPRGTHRRDAFG